MKKRDANSFDGFTLLEVILALAILGGALAVLGEVWRLGGRSANDATAETRAQLLADSLLDQVLCGAVEAAEADRQPFDATEVVDSVPWLYSLHATAGPVAGLRLLEIVVEQDLAAELNPVRYRLVRWAPTIAEPAEAKEESETMQAAAKAQGEQTGGAGVGTPGGTGGPAGGAGT